MGCAEPDAAANPAARVISGRPKRVFAESLTSSRRAEFLYSPTPAAAVIDFMRIQPFSDADSGSSSPSVVRCGGLGSSTIAGFEKETFLDEKSMNARTHSPNPR